MIITKTHPRTCTSATRLARLVESISVTSKGPQGCPHLRSGVLRRAESSGIQQATLLQVLAFASAIFKNADLGCHEGNKTLYGSIWIKTPYDHRNWDALYRCRCFGADEGDIGLAVKTLLVQFSRPGKRHKVRSA